jgi:uncharacterized protein (TIGR02300 family)
MANALLRNTQGGMKVKPEWGTKRVCHKCAVHFYDLNQATFKCPKCEAAYTSADFVLKHSKSTEISSKKEMRKKAAPLALEEQIEDINTEIDTEIETDDLIEDADDLEDEDVHAVIKHEEDAE